MGSKNLDAILESGLYYLQSRYYNPEAGRFLNADALASAGQGIIGSNMFVYCLNNPANLVDSTGQFSSTILGFLEGAVNSAARMIMHVAEAIGIDSAAFGAKALDMYESDNGVYHASVDCWQKNFGYNALYDVVFDLATSMETKNFAFSHDNTDYIIWVWKGDYINLGAGAELGIYYGGGPHWFVDTNLAMPMTLSLNYNGTNIISHQATTWWMTGFNSNYSNIPANALSATFSLDFSGNPGLFMSFYSTYNGTLGWSFDKRNYNASFTF